MNSPTNIEIVQNAYAAFSRSDIPAILAALDPNVEWIVPGNTPDSGTYRGPAEVGRFFGMVAGLWQFHAFEPRDYIAAGDQVAALGSFTASARGGVRTADVPWCMVWTISDGRVTRFQEYSDTQAMAGLLSAAQAA